MWACHQEELRQRGYHQDELKNEISFVQKVSVVGGGKEVEVKRQRYQGKKTDDCQGNGLKQDDCKSHQN